MSLRIVWRSGLGVLVALAAMMVAARARQTATPALAWAGGAAILLAAPAVPIALLRWIPPPTTAMMLRSRRSADGERRVAFDWVPLDRIARPMWVAAIVAEDAFFRDHSGFDWASIREAAAYNRVHARKRGASTITQQVAKNLFLWPARSYVRKGIEAYLTALIEALWPKRRILEVYLNVAQFGEGVFGVQAAARRYFGKQAGDLTDVNAALLAAALPGPRLYQVDRPSHQLRFRQAWIRAAMRRLGEDSVDWL